jgi:hypothetical protein
MRPATGFLSASLLAVGLVACDGKSNGTTAPSEPNQPGADLNAVLSHGTCKGSGTVRYAVSPMALADVGEFIPLGVMVGGHVTPVDHQYLVPKDLSAGRTHYNVVAPFAGNVVSIQPRIKQAGDPGTAPVGSVDYRIVFEGSCTYWVYYDLVTQLEPSLLAAGGSKLAANQSVDVRIPVTAGQAIGKVGGQTLDLGTVDANVTLTGFVVPSHYDLPKLHAMDGLDYFDEPIRSQLNALNRRKALPRGGKIDFDIDGKASGNWFLLGSGGYFGLNQGNGAYWAGHLSLVYGHIDPALIMISMGFADGSSRQWTVRGNGPDPAKVDATNGAIKYELTEWRGDSVSTNANLPAVGVLLVQVLAGRQLRVEYFPGVMAGAVTGFDAAAKIYER